MDISFDTFLASHYQDNSKHYIIQYCKVTMSKNLYKFTSSMDISYEFLQKEFYMKFYNLHRNYTEHSFYHYTRSKDSFVCKSCPKYVI